MKMKFPQVETLQKSSSWGEGENTEKKFKLIIECIDYIWDGDSIYKAKDSTKKELTDFLEALNSRQFQKVRNFDESLLMANKIIWLRFSSKKNHAKKGTKTGAERAIG